jgi:hypothetical protein
VHDPCDACGEDVNEEVERTTRRLLASLDERRKAKLADIFEGRSVPEVLCAPCFNPILATVNEGLVYGV